MNPQLTPPATPPASAKRPYTPPRLLVHGDVRTLTQGKNGILNDVDGGGSFNPVAAGE
jgi:hypothetical protein